MGAVLNYPYDRETLRSGVVGSGVAQVAQIKGSNILPIVKAMRKMGTFARDALPARLHRYLDERILVSSWYPEADALLLMKSFVKVTPQLGADPWPLLGRLSANGHAMETYKHLLVSRDVDSVVRQAHVLWQSYHDTGRITVKHLGDCHYSLELSEFEALTDEWCDLLVGYHAGIVEAVGGHSAKCCVTERDVPNKRVCWELRWSAPKIWVCGRRRARVTVGTSLGDPPITWTVPLRR